MPESVLLDKILPCLKLSDVEWLSLIDERANLVHYSMDRVRLTKLVDFGFAPSDLGGGCVVTIIGLMGSYTCVVDGGYLLHVEGIYRSVCSRGEESRADRWSHVFGFTRDGSWLVADILEGSQGGLRIIKELEVRPSSPESIIRRFSIDYRQILFFLTEQYTSWVEKKREVLNRMERVHSQMARDDLIIDSMYAKSGRR